MNLASAHRRDDDEYNDEKDDEGEHDVATS
jgi:hypothetical protein